jgi:hypothetical protein
MTRPAATRSRRGLMYALVAAQLLVLAAIVGPQELNMALDASPAIDVEIINARASRDAFKGAHVRGESALDLEGRAAVLPAGGVRPGDRVLVTFAVAPDGRPRISGVERGRRARPFTATSFAIPGRVIDDRDPSSAGWREGQLIARVGDPPLRVALELPATIAVDESAVTRLAAPGLVRASLHAGFLGRPYFTDVRLAGHGWTADARFVYDDTRGRLMVLSPREMTGRASVSDARVRSDVFVFDGTGREVVARELDGRVVDAAVASDGRVLALVSADRWSYAQVSLVQLAEDGQVLQRSVPVAFDRVLGFDAPTGSLWILAGPTSARPEPPHFIQRMAVTGLREPRLGPFDSVPRLVLSPAGDVWVVETERHRLTRLDGASGRVVREYRDLNSPVDVAVDAGSIYVIEANRTQLTRLAEDGRVVWRVPRLSGLTWVVAEPGAGGGWVGASRFDGAAAGLLRFGLDGAMARVGAAAQPAPRARLRRIGADGIRSADGRLFFFERQAIAILSPDGATVTRVVGFRFPAAQRLRS